jgi:formamidopyrimidine-DNA glycosylase
MLSDEDIADDEQEYGEFVKVYERAGEPCIRCRRPIVQIEIDGGAMMFSCSACQT